jgi:hypothetical protein
MVDIVRGRKKLNTLNIFSNLWERRLKTRQLRYKEQLSNQAIRLERIARLLHCDPNEAQELMELMAEWLSGEGILKKGFVKPSCKRVQQQEPNDDIKLFLLQNGLCD